MLTIDEPRRRGFVYGTLPGHPLAGEERMSIELDEVDHVVLRIESVSDLAGVARLAPPPSRAGQHRMRRYARMAPFLVDAA